MSDQFSEKESPLAALKSDAARQRWELFHRAIAHAKQSNHTALEEADEPVLDAPRRGPLLTIAR